MSLRVVSLLASRLGFSLSRVVTSGRLRQASRDAKFWPGTSYGHGAADHRPGRGRNEVFEDEKDFEDVDEKLQDLLGEQRRKQRTVRFHQMRRQMTPPGAPERTLSWDAMEQIRYLKREDPAEWTVERLAEGFSVTPDVVLRVLRSKFVNSPERRAKQDATVLAKLRQQQSLSAGARPGQERLPAGGATAGALVTLAASQSLMPREDGVRALATTGGSLAPLPSTQNRASLLVSSKRSSLTELSAAEEANAAAENVFEEEEEEEEDEWDGYVFTEEELEELVHSIKPSPVTQDGDEFFDSDGVFLYRI